MRIRALLVVAMFAAPLLPVGAAASGVSFAPVNGNDWWIQVRVNADVAIDGVDARVNGGAWHPLRLQSWGDWAAGKHAPAGSVVEFRARSGSQHHHSVAYDWPSGQPATSPPPASPPADVVFKHGGGNEWWVQVAVLPRPDQVEAMDTNGAWTRLDATSWGQWAKSFRIEVGHLVKFRASHGGTWTDSCWYTHPAGSPGCDAAPAPAPAPAPGGLDARFEPRAGNEWWIQVHVAASERVAGVSVGIDGGAWKPLELKSWGDWAASHHAPTGSKVTFRATGGSGATATSGAYQWPAATPAPAPAPDGGAGSMLVRVDANVHLADVDRRLYGMNIADWSPLDYHPTRNADYVAYLKALQPGVLRWPAGHTSQEYRWERGPATGQETRVLTAAHVESYIQLSRAVGAEPAISVNLKTGTPEAAADLVRYVNFERGHDVRWWMLGNEPDLPDGKTRNAEAYAESAVRFATAMKKVDPSIRLVGGELMTGSHVVGSNGRRDWMTPIAQIAGHHLDALGWHYYPLDSGQPNRNSGAYPTIPHLFQEEARDWRPAGMSFVEEAFPHLRRVRDAHSPGSEIWVTEIAEDSGGGGKEGIVDTMAGALWTADILGRLAAQNADAVTRFVFKSGSTHRFNLLDHQMQPRPTYYAYWLTSREFGDDIVKTTSADRTKVAAHASIRDDGKLAILLVNKDTKAHDVTVDLRGYGATRVRAYDIVGDHYGDRTVTVNGITLTPQTVGRSAPAEAESWTGATRVPASSIRMLVLS